MWAYYDNYHRLIAYEEATIHGVLVRCVQLGAVQAEPADEENYDVYRI